jgi:hypothetical protein
LGEPLTKSLAPDWTPRLQLLNLFSNPISLQRVPFSLTLALTYNADLFSGFWPRERAPRVSPQASNAAVAFPSLIHSSHANNALELVALLCTIHSALGVARQNDEVCTIPSFRIVRLMMLRGLLQAATRQRRAKMANPALWLPQTCTFEVDSLANQRNNSINMHLTFP